MRRGAISIHASRGGSDQLRSIPERRIKIFQSTLPAGEATQLSLSFYPISSISIHASRGGSDRPRRRPLRQELYNFNPRFPRGKRQARRNLSEGLDKFQSTLPAGEATKYLFIFEASHQYFNPRFPRGKRRSINRVYDINAEFQSTLPAGEATSRTNTWRSSRQYFNPRFPRGKRRQRSFLRR